MEVLNGQARLFGFPGVADGTAYSGLSGVTVTTGSGNDSLEFDVQTLSSFDVRVDTGLGEGATKVKWRLLPGAAPVAANIWVLGESQVNNLVEVDVESENRNASISIDAGRASDIVAKVNSSNPSDFLRVVFGGNARKSLLEVGSQASTVEVEVRGGGTTLEDELIYKITQSRPASVNVNWAVDALAGSDKVEALIAASGSTVTQRGTVFGRAGDDQIKIESDAFSTVNGVTLNGGAGNDDIQLVIKGRFQLSQTLIAQLLGADGDDALLLTTDTGIFGTGQPNDRIPVVDCGLGNDRFNAFGLIRGCESRF